VIVVKTPKLNFLLFQMQAATSGSAGIPSRFKDLVEKAVSVFLFL